MFAVTKEGGKCIGFPDTCLTPSPPGSPVGVIYSNTAHPSNGSRATTKVFVHGMPALTLASRIPMSSGDEAGVKGGIVSGTHMDEMEFSMSSQTVKLEGNPAVRLGDSTKHNSGNAIGNVLSPSQFIVSIVS